MKIDERYFAKSEEQKTTIESVLRDDERILWRAKPNASSYIWAAVWKMLPIALLWLAFDVAFLYFIISGMIQGGIPTWILGIVVPFFALHLTPVWMWIANIVKSKIEIKNLEYALTDRRIIRKSGVIGIDFQFVNYEEVDTVNVRVGLIDKIFHVGDVYVNAKQQATILFDIEDPYDIATKLQQVVSDIKADMHFPNALRPEENVGYRTAYAQSPFDEKR